MTRFDQLYSVLARPALEHQFGELTDITFITRRVVDTEYTIEGAIQRGATEREQPLGALITNSASTVWSIDAAKLTAAGIDFKEGDVIKDSDEVEWTIRGWNEVGLSTQYDFICQKGRI